VRPIFNSHHLIIVHVAFFEARPFERFMDFKSEVFLHRFIFINTFIIVAGLAWSRFDREVKFNLE